LAEQNNFKEKPGLYVELLIIKKLQFKF